MLRKEAILRLVASVVCWIVLAASFAQDLKQVYRYNFDSVATANGRVAFDQAGFATWVAAEDGNVRNVRVAIDTAGSVNYQKRVAGSQITGLHNLEDGGVIIATSSKNASGQDFTTLHSWSADGAIYRTVPLPGPAQTILDPAGFVVALVKPLSGSRATLVRYDPLLIRDWALSIPVDGSIAIDRYRLGADTNGNLYPAVPFSSLHTQLLKYTAQGSLSRSWGVDGVIQLDFSQIRGLAAAPSGFLYYLFLDVNPNSTRTFAITKIDQNGRLANISPGVVWQRRFLANQTFSQLTTNERGDALVANDATGEVTKLDVDTAVAQVAPTTLKTAIIDGSDNQFLYRLHTGLLSGSLTKQVAVLEKYDWSGRVSVWTKVITAGDDLMKPTDLVVDRGGNIAVSALFANKNAQNALAYQSTFMLLDQSGVKTRQRSNRDALFTATGRSVYSPTVNDVEYTYSPIRVNNYQKPFTFSSSDYFGLEFTVDLGLFSFTVDLGRFGGSVSGSFAGKFGIDFRLKANLGSFNVVYPISLISDAPDQSDPSMAPGKTVTVKFDYVPDSTASLSTTPFSLRSGFLSGYIGWRKSSNISAEAFSRTLFDLTLEQLVAILFPGLISGIAAMPDSFDTDFKLFDIDIADKLQYTFRKRNVNIFVKVPMVRTNGVMEDPKK